MKRVQLWSISALILHSCSAAVSAGQNDASTQSPRSTGDLLAAFSNAASFWQQGEVARQIVALGDKSVLPKMQKYVETDDRRRRCNAGLVLAGLGDRRGLAIVIKELGDKASRPTDIRASNGTPNPKQQITEDRYCAALLLGQLRDKEAVPALIEALSDETIDYRSAISLGEIGDKTAIPALRKMAEDCAGRSSFRRLWAGYGLAALGETEGLDILAEVSASDSNWVDRRHAVEALGKTSDPRAVPIVVKALKDNHANVRVSAVRALRELGDPSAIPALTEKLHDTEETKVNAPTTPAREASQAIEAIKAGKK